MIRLIHKSKTADSPFFILHTTPLPHVPLQVKLSHSGLYQGVAEPRRTYLQMISLLDESVGRMVKALEDAQIGDNTVIIFMSDVSVHCLSACLSVCQCLSACQLILLSSLLS